jgi:ABC-type nickel/cobalt efflux system permease component RcnA
MLVISAGVIPCPGTVTVFLFAISMQLYLVGVLAAAAMSLGMGSVLFAVSAAGITSRNRLAERHTKLTRFVEFSSMGIIFILGILLLLVEVG